MMASGGSFRSVYIKCDYHFETKGTGALMTEIWCEHNSRWRQIDYLQFSLLLISSMVNVIGCVFCDSLVHPLQTSADDKLPFGCTRWWLVLISLNANHWQNLGFDDGCPTTITIWQYPQPWYAVWFPSQWYCLRHTLTYLNDNRKPHCD